MVATGPLEPLSMVNAEELRRRLDVGVLRPDPRIGSHPPAWLAHRPDWHDVLDGMTIEDCDWLGDNWRMATDGMATRKSRWRW